MTKREFLDTVFALAPNEANAIMDAFDEYVESNVVPTGRSGKERRMTKYIIEIPDDIQYVLFNGKADNKYYTAVRPIAELEELNSDYINEHYGEMQDEAYQAGMDKAWEAAKRIVDMPDPPYWDVFGKCKSDLFKKLSASEAIAKLKVYDDGKRSDRIEVGDEVINNVYNSPAIVTNVSNAGIYVLWKDGSGSWKRAEQFHKTGKHYDIASILEAMRE